MTSPAWVFLRDRVLPPRNSALIALVVGATWVWVVSYLPTHGWQPVMGTFPYSSLGVVVTLVLLVRDRFPRLTLVGLALFYPGIYDEWLRTFWHVLPFALAGYTVAARGVLRTPWTLLLAVGGVAREWFAYSMDPRDWTLTWMLRNGFGSLYEFDVSRAGLFVVVVVATVLLGRASYRQRRANEELRHRQEEVERLRQIETDQMVAAERTRIARELHDVVAHHISAVVLRAQAADRVADAQPEQLREAVRWIALDGQHTLAAMRQVVKVLRSTGSGASLTPQTTLGEIPAIAERMAGVGMPVDLDLPPVTPILPAAVELAAVRIIQESLTNALVHARAGRALVRMQAVGEDLVLEIHDDGGRAEEPATSTGRWARRAVTQPSGLPLIGTSGTQPMPVRRSSTFGSGHGLVGMRERATSCGGALEIGRSHLGGWLIRARLSMAVEQEPGQDQFPQAV